MGTSNKNMKQILQEKTRMIQLLKTKVMNGESLDVDRFVDFVRKDLKINKSRKDVER